MTTTTNTLLPTKQVLLFDINNIMYSSAYNPYKVYSKDDDLPIHIFRGTMSKIGKILAEYEQGEFEAYVLWDAEEEYWRNAIFDKYKQRRSNELREKMKEDCARARPYFKELFKQMGFNQLFADKHEADDISPVVIQQFMAINPEIKITIFTNDRDSWQLVSENVECQQITAPHLNITLENFSEITGFKSPKHFMQAKWLMEDSSDAINGVLEKEDVVLLMQHCDDVIQLLDDKSYEIPSDVKINIDRLRSEPVRAKIEHNRLLTTLDGHNLNPDEIKCIAAEPEYYFCNRLARSLGTGVSRKLFQKINAGV